MSINEIQNSLIEIYINLKIRKTEEVNFKFLIELS